MLERVEKVAVRDTSVLITGESGTGKELIAQAIHYNSLRKDKKFVAINCGALPESLLESELFGYRKGAFTGAKENRQGLLEAADGGTLFLDEVGNLPMNVQKTLLRFLQEQEFHRIGDTTPTKVDVRILSATNSDLKAAVKSGAVPRGPLLSAERGQYPPPAAAGAAGGHPAAGRAFHRPAEQQVRHAGEGTFSGSAGSGLHVFLAGEHPGIEECDRGLDGDGKRRVPDPSGAGAVHRPAPRRPGRREFAGDEGEYAQALSRFEMDYLKGLLRKNRGNIEAAAREAGMNMATIYRKIKKYNIRKEDYS